MLLKLIGSSCSGKTTLAYAAAAWIGKIAVHDFDPPDDLLPVLEPHGIAFEISRALEA
ncbi:hypothetical protein PV367_14325 [Streptomyces europaeiscabiei]|uniref:Uncharacterized protein n=1 Tax=Streptomyces europaeiscabiei TaxID=146819 RepID=A0AAJ2ULM1_9ACTN|nr:hypothetical protein [Streptomyces europaeiscabiei]MDX3130934.1 hypothetical protein [Streptomyces europaeiscabiei]